MKKTIILYIIFAINLIMPVLFAPQIQAYANIGEDFSAKAMYLMEYETGTVLFEKNAKESETHRFLPHGFPISGWNWD